MGYYSQFSQTSRWILAGIVACILLLLITALAHAQCGSEFIHQKDLTISDTAFLRESPARTTVEKENALPRSTTARLITISATLTGYKIEADGDFHLCLKDGAFQMIAEIPNPDCPEVQRSSQYQTMKRIREWFLANIGRPTSKMKKCSLPVTITGVEFFDKIHGQASVAKNGVEIHPCLTITK